MHLLLGSDFLSNYSSMKKIKNKKATNVGRYRTIQTQLRWNFTDELLNDSFVKNEDGDIVIEKRQLVDLLMRHFPNDLKINPNVALVEAVFSISLEG